MKQKTLFRVVILTFALTSLSRPSASISQNSQTDGYRRQTSVTLIPRSPDGQPISLTRADLYLDVWGGGQLVRLPRNSQSVTVRLDQDWLCSAWTDICKSRIDPARIVLQANGYAPVTVVVYWPGQPRSEGGTPAKSAGIEFSGRPEVRIEEGSLQNINITFRHPISHTLRIVEENRAPAPGIPLDAGLYFAATNHVGAIEGETLASGKTDANGEISFPDVDGEVAIELQRGRYVLQDPDRVSPFRKIITPPGAATTTTLVLHRFQKQPLNINFVSRDGSAAGLILGTCLKYCAGACCGDEATTNSMGQIRVEDFYPEEIDSLYLTDKSGTVLWKSAPPRIGASTAIPTITIPATR